MSSFKKAVGKFKRVQHQQQETCKIKIAQRDVFVRNAFQVVYDFLKDDQDFYDYLVERCLCKGTVVFACMNYGTVERNGEIRGDNVSPERISEKNSWRIECAFHENAVALQTMTRNHNRDSVPFSLADAPDEVWEALLPTLEVISDRERLLEFLFKQFPPKL